MKIFITIASAIACVVATILMIVFLSTGHPVAGIIAAVLAIVFLIIVMNAIIDVKLRKNKVDNV